MTVTSCVCVCDGHAGAAAGGTVHEGKDDGSINFSVIKFGEMLDN